jgi:hypothetical protein
MNIRPLTIRRALHLAPAALLVLALAACGSGSHPEATPVTVFNVSSDPGANLPAVNARHQVRLTRAEVKVSFDALLSNHAKLVAALMHEVGAGNDHPNAAIAALATNTQLLTNAIAMIYGTDSARAFAQLWEQHTQFFIDYAQADRNHDHKAKDEAEDRLTDYQNDFGSFVSTATGGRVPLLAVTRLLHGHVEDMTDYIDSDVAGHAAEARHLLDQAVAHMHIIAGAVSDAIVRQRLATVRP